MPIGGPNSPLMQEDRLKRVNAGGRAGKMRKALEIGMGDVALVVGALDCTTVSAVANPTLRSCGRLRYETRTSLLDVHP